jgi:hypothetical protein
VWQQKFQQYGDSDFTVVGIALDAEGIGPAKIYYDKFGVTFPALVDPNYATAFTAVPKTFFIDERGVVQPLDKWEQKLGSSHQLTPVTEKIRSQWSPPEARFDPQTITRLVKTLESEPGNLAVAVDLASRYSDLGPSREAASVLRPIIRQYDPHEVARSQDRTLSQLLAQAYFQFSRASVGNRDDQVRNATLSFYLNPSVGYGKQISRIIAPEKFDDRPNGNFDNQFREATLRRLRREREKWLGGSNTAIDSN